MASIPTILSVTINVIVTAILLLVALLIRVGKGDKLIAGYNTASEKERAKYDITRLRRVISWCLILITALLWLPNLIRALTDHVKPVVYFIWSTLILVVVVATLILANTWAKKK